MAPCISVQYSCPGCGIVDRSVSVPVRGEEDVMAWMDIVVMAISNDHKQHSDFCKATHMHQIKIPMPPGTAKVGGPVVN